MGKPVNPETEGVIDDSDLTEVEGPGWRSWFNDIDAEIAAEYDCPECGQGLEYFGREEASSRQLRSRRSFALCKNPDCTFIGIEF